MYKITGVNYGIPSPEGGYRTEEKVCYALCKWTMKLKSSLIRMLYDEVWAEYINLTELIKFKK